MAPAIPAEAASRAPASACTLTEAASVGASWAARAGGQPATAPQQSGCVLLQPDNTGSG